MSGTGRSDVDQLDYWDQRLSQNFNLAGVGYLNLGESYNHWLYRSKVRAFRRAIRGLVINLHRARVLDVGSGTGFWIEQFKRHGARDIVGVDTSETSVEILAKRYPEQTLMLGDVGNPSFSVSGQFDIISAFEVMWYLSEEQFRAAFANFARVAVPGAYFLITDRIATAPTPAPPRSSREHPRDLQAYARECAAVDARVLAVFPLYCLMNSPSDAGSVTGKLRRHLIVHSWKVVERLLRRCQWLGHPLGAMLYLVDGMLLNVFGVGPSTKLLVGQFGRSAE